MSGSQEQDDASLPPAGEVPRTAPLALWVYSCSGLSPGLAPIDWVARGPS